MKVISKNSEKIFFIIILGLVFILGIYWLIYYEPSPGKYDNFAQCLKDRKAVLYGAFWCIHCQKQKAAFGKSAKFLPYVECSTPDGKNQLKICQDKKIKSYPTWEFSDGSRLTGEISLTNLSEKTGCPLP